MIVYYQYQVQVECIGFIVRNLTLIKEACDNLGLTTFSMEPVDTSPKIKQSIRNKFIASGYNTDDFAADVGYVPEAVTILTALFGAKQDKPQFGIMVCHCRIYQKGPSMSNLYFSSLLQLCSLRTYSSRSGLGFKAFSELQ